MTRSRYVIGVDLGTTNTVVSYIDTEETPETGAPVIRLLPVPQLVADREVRELAALPSFLYFAEEREVEAGATRTPWDPHGRVVVGALARDRGALVPGRQVASAKSWLCHPGVDRTAEILPWGNEDPNLGCSPVEASARYLAHLRDTWNHSVTAAGLADDMRFERQDVVVTVPASFDDEARELTVQAAFQAGIERFALLEEPLAAFYAWIVSYRDSLAERLADDDLVLVCDVGGGTTDFSLVRARVRGGDAEFERIAVGEHLLLGGDNVDFALARRLEERLGNPRLSLRQRNALRQQCRVAKERLLSDPDLERAPVTVLGGGGALVGGALATELTVDDVEETIVLGFLPITAPGERPARERQTGLREIGLPYVHDPAITRHLAEFLDRAGEGRGMLRPDAVLFNGGFFTPEGARDQTVEAIASWFRSAEDPEWRPKVLVDAVAESAVAVGAAYYGLVRRGEGLRVGGGTARAYYVGVETGEPAAPGEIAAVCVVPRGTEEGAVLRLEDRSFALLANRPVSFALYSSTTRRDEHGALVALREDEVHHHAPLASVLRYGRRDARVELAVRVAAGVTEMGTLELWCESIDTPNRWRLQFQLQGRAERPEEGGEPARERPRVVISEGAVEEAGRLVRAVFGGAYDALPGGPLTPGALMARLEAALGHGKDAWPVETARALFDHLVPLAKGRRKSARHEARYLNLLGFCLRPGFGAPGDDRRVERAREVEGAGLAFASDVQCQVEREVFVQRMAGGLDAARQQEIYERLREALGVGERGASRRLNPQLERESWRVLASLEHLPATVRARLGAELLRKLKADPSNRSYPWALARLGARIPFHGPTRSVVSPKIAAEWIAALLALEPLTPELAFAVSQIGARTNDSNRDVDEVVRQRAIARLGAAGFRERTLAPLRRYVAPEAGQASRIFGESLPAGLRLVG